MRKHWIVVADAARARIFDADAEARAVSEVAALVHPESRAHDRELESDRGGRSFDSVGEGRHAMSRHVSPHDMEADRFARRLAGRLHEGTQQGEFTLLDIAAPPAFMGLLRKHLKNDVRSVLEIALTKDLVAASPEAIAAQFLGRKRRELTH